MLTTEVIIIGAGAAGLMCAATAAARGRQVLLLDHANKAGKKILMSGGGRCNFTNLYTEPANFLSGNPHFCKSALARYTQWDFIELVARHGVPYHEKKLGQLFCDHKSSDILAMLLAECTETGVELRLDTSVQAIERVEGGYRLQTSAGAAHCQSLVIATGGLSIPRLAPPASAIRWLASSATRCCRPAPAWCPSLSPTRRSRRCAASCPALRLTAW